MIRFAYEKDLVHVNELRKMVNDLHAISRPDIFKQGFDNVLNDLLFEIWKSEDKRIIVADFDGNICGYACIHFVNKRETVYRKPMNYIDVDEFGVDINYRRKGLATDMMTFIFDYAKQSGFNRVELNMWDFNDGALAFYEAVGFRTYRRFLEAKI